MGDALGLCQNSRQVVIVARSHPLYLTGIHIFLILYEYWVIDRVQ